MGRGDQIRDEARAVQHATGWSYTMARRFSVEHRNEAALLLRLRGEEATRRSLRNELVELAKDNGEADE